MCSASQSGISGQAGVPDRIKVQPSPSSFSAWAPPSSHVTHVPGSQRPTLPSCLAPALPPRGPHACTTCASSLLIDPSPILPPRDPHGSILAGKTFGGTGVTVTSNACTRSCSRERQQHACTYLNISARAPTPACLLRVTLDRLRRTLLPVYCKQCLIDCATHSYLSSPSNA